MVNIAASSVVMTNYKIDMTDMMLLIFSFKKFGNLQGMIDEMFSLTLNISLFHVLSIFAIALSMASTVFSRLLCLYRVHLHGPSASALIVP